MRKSGNNYLLKQSFQARFCLFLFAILGVSMPQLIAQEALDLGYRTSWQYPSNTSANGEVTAEKPESKLWVHDGRWWASMWSNTGNAYHIFYLDMATHGWIDTGVQLDPRNDTKADALLDGDTLYVVSHVWNGSGGNASAGGRGQLFRYVYDSVNQTWIQNLGGPGNEVEVNSAEGESLVIAKDSQGILWVTYVKNQDVYINHTVTSDADWATPFVLPVGSPANVSDDDVSGMIAFNGKIGIMWSDQSGGNTTYFAVHNDGDAPNLWGSVEAYSSDTDDHINVKSLACDDTGSIYAAVKGGGSPVIVMVHCPGNLDPLDENSWEVHTVFGSSGSNSPTRPQLLVDIGNREVYVFVRYRESSNNGDIFYKVSDLDNISFSSATPFIQSTDDIRINDPTTTKQCVDGNTDLVVLASDSQQRRYYHNVLELGPATPEPDITVSPSSHNYGPVVVGSSAQQTFTVGNNGDIALSITSTSITGTDDSEFSIESGGGSFSLNPGETHDIRVDFNPSSNGAKSAALTIVSNDPDESPLDVGLSGTGETPSPDISVTPTSHDYGDVENGTSTAPQTFTVRNDGVEDLEVSATNLTGPDAGEFSFDSGNGSFTLEPAEERDIEIIFSPTSPGAKSATLSIESNDPNEDPFDVPLSGNSIPPPAPEIAVDPDSVGFGVVVVANPKFVAGALSSVKVINDGTAPLNVSAANLTGTHTSEFSIENGGAPFSVAAGDTHTIELGFTPVTLGEKTAALEILSDDADEGTITIPLTGTGVESLSVVTYEETHSGGSSGINSVSTSTSVAAFNGQLYVAAIATKNYVESDGVTGLGLTWSKAAAQCAGRNQTGVDIWWAIGSVTTSEAVTATFSSNPTNAIIIVNRYNGASVSDPIGNIVSGNTNGEDGACDGGSDGNAYSFNIAATSTGAAIFAAAAMRNKTHTPGAGFQERDEVIQGSGGSAASLAVQDSVVENPATVAAAGTFNSNVDWAMAAVEILPGAGSTPTAPKLVLAPPSHDFGSVEVGSNRSTTFVVTNDSTGDLNISDISISGTDAGDFSVTSGGDPVTVLPGETHDIEVQFAPGSEGSKSASLDITSDDANNPVVNAALSGEGIDLLPVFSLPVAAGWNMVGLPAERENYHYLSIFPNAVENSLFDYDAGYMSADSLHMCKGYWIKFPASETTEVAGTPITSCSFDLAAGWNMIGGISSDVALEDVVDNGNIIIPGTVFGFSGSYVPADTIKMGRGYWVQAIAPGTITLNAAAKNNDILAKKISKLADLTPYPTLEIQDASSNANARQLYFDVALDTSQDLHSYTLPPLAPVGFDARFAGDLRIAEGDNAIIKVQSQDYPLTFKAANLPLGAAAQYTLTEVLGSKDGEVYELRENETIIIQDARVNTLRLGKVVAEVPAEFALFQNYPNPFNPTTEIRYSLPQKEAVELTIYNALGQRVKTLLQTRQEAGIHQVAWDGTNEQGQLVSSGIYLYRISAGSFNQMKKMILLK